ncbi:VOC family protein [Longitalea arenae]|uniref:VOC family protein n=1 Tax=Longitalea arenae TaxID=2812558 RepID=UPI0019673117|nr:VOC family protein [Longitalea arenae]
MATKIFVNLPVKDLAKSINFFSNLGFSFNPQFTDDKAACMIISDQIFAMLLTDSYFTTFTAKKVCDTKTSTEVLIALDAASKEEVQQYIHKARDGGARIYAEPQDHGWMYQHSFEDLDGHQWEILYMNEAQLPNN